MFQHFCVTPKGIRRLRVLWNAGILSLTRNAQPWFPNIQIQPRHSISSSAARLWISWWDTGILKVFPKLKHFGFPLSAPSHFPSVSPWLHGWNFPGCSLDCWTKPEFPGFCVWTLLAWSCIISHKKFILACFCHSFEVSTSSKFAWRFSNRLYVEHCCQHLKIHISWRQILGSRGSWRKVTAWTFVHWLKHF